MKIRIRSTLIICVFCVLSTLFALTSCYGNTGELVATGEDTTEGGSDHGNTAEPVASEEDTTNGGTESSADAPALPEGYFAAPTVEEARKRVLDYYYQMSQVKWICKSDMDFTKGQPFTSRLYYKAGETYYGIPYCSRLAYLEQFRMVDDENGYYTGPIKYDTCIGNSCASSIRVAMNTVSGNITAWSSADFYPWTDKGLVKVGDYDWNGIDVSQRDKLITKTVNDKNGVQTIYEAYALLIPGDTIAARWKSGSSVIGHARLISAEPTVVRNGKGEINGTKSYLTVYEQCSSFNEKSDVNTTFKINSIYSFKDLFEDGYIPSRLAEFEKGEIADAQITCSKVSSAKTAIGSAYPSGTISCDNYIILHVKVEFIDSDGKVATYAEYAPKEKSVKLDGRPFSVPCKDLPEGDYRYVVTITIGPGVYTYCDTPVHKK